MGTKKILAAVFCAVLILAFVGSVAAYTWQSFGFAEGQSPKLKVPTVTLSAAEENKLYEGKPIAKLLDGPDGLKQGYLRFFAPFDPVTAFMVVTDADHFSMEDPAFPKTGSITDKKRTFMPYTFDAATCVENGEPRMNQLLVMPFVDPRRLCIKRYHSTSAFPWESYWTLASDKECCKSKMNPAMKKYFDNAVYLQKNTGCWHISPLPKKFLKSDADIMRSDLVYFVDTNPGGDLGKIKAIVNKATSIALPTLVDNVNFHGKRWEQYLAKHHGPAMVAKYKEWVEQYKQSMTAQ